MSAQKCRIAVIYYSVHGHVRQLAEQVFEGIQAVEGCEPVMFQVAETLPPAVLEKIKPVPRGPYPNIKPEQLPEFDGLIL